MINANEELVKGGLGALIALLVGLHGMQEGAAQYRGGMGQGPRTDPRTAHRYRSHVYLGGQVTGLAVVSQVTDYDTGYLGNGGGIGLHGGVRVSPYLSLELNWGLTFHDETWEEGNRRITWIDSIYLMSITADAKVHIPTWGPFEPFLQGGIGFAYIGATYDDVEGDAVFARGPAFNLGGGVDLALLPSFSVGGRILYRGMYFDDPYIAPVDRFGGYGNYVSGLGIDLYGSIHF